MKKLLGLVCAGAVAAMMSGCGLANPASNVDISIASIGAVNAGGAAGQVTGTIKADSIITGVTMAVLNSSDVDVSTQFTVSFTSGYTGKKSADLKTDMSTTVAAKAGTLAGTYKLKITATAGSITSSSTKEFTVTGGSGTPVVPATLTIGSYANATLGSSVDLDNGTVMLAAAATASGSGVDIVGTYSTLNGGSFRVLSPTYAANSSGIIAFQGWVNPAATLMHKVTGVTFASITTKEQIQPLFNAALATDNVSCAQGDLVVVKTDQNAYVLVEITSFDASTSGTATIKSDR